jgi:hypothetical protein
MENTLFQAGTVTTSAQQPNSPPPSSQPKSTTSGIVEERTNLWLSFRVSLDNAKILANEGLEPEMASWITDVEIDDLRTRYQGKLSIGTIVVLKQIRAGVFNEAGASPAKTDTISPTSNIPKDKDRLHSLAKPVSNASTKVKADVPRYSKGKELAFISSFELFLLQNQVSPNSWFSYWIKCFTTLEEVRIFVDKKNELEILDFSEAKKELISLLEPSKDEAALLTEILSFRPFPNESIKSYGARFKEHAACTGSLDINKPHAVKIFLKSLPQPVKDRIATSRMDGFTNKSKLFTTVNEVIQWVDGLYSSSSGVIVRTDANSKPFKCTICGKDGHKPRDADKGINKQLLLLRLQLQNLS